MSTATQIAVALPRGRWISQRAGQQLTGLGRRGFVAFVQAAGIASLELPGCKPRYDAQAIRDAIARSTRA